MTVWCHECGSANSGSDQFCVNCGCPLKPPPTVTPSNNQSVAPDATQSSATSASRGSGRTPAQTILAVIALLLIGITVGVAIRDAGALDAILASRVDLDEAATLAEYAYLDGHMGIRVTEPGSTISSIEYSTSIGADAEPGICVNMNRTTQIDRWGWTFVRPDTSMVDFAFDVEMEPSDNWCYYEDYLHERVGEFGQFDQLAIYIRVDGVWDRLVVPMPLD